jgi:hypothetical protein
MTTERTPPLQVWQAAIPSIADCQNLRRAVRSLHSRSNSLKHFQQRYFPATGREMELWNIRQYRLPALTNNRRCIGLCKTPAVWVREDSDTLIVSWLQLSETGTPKEMLVSRRYFWLRKASRHKRVSGYLARKDSPVRTGCVRGYPCNFPYYLNHVAPNSGPNLETLDGATRDYPAFCPRPRPLKEAAYRPQAPASRFLC